MPEPEIRKLQALALEGYHLRTSLTGKRTETLWNKLLGKIPNPQLAVKYAVEVYDDLTYFSDFDVNREFDRYVGVVAGSYELDEEVVNFKIPGGLYAVFDYRGSVQNLQAFYGSIFLEWLPNSSYSLDHRPFFSRMDERYKHNSDNIVEEIYIPIS